MHGRVRPCAKAEVVSNKLFPKSEDTVLNYLKSTQVRILCGKFLREYGHSAYGAACKREEKFRACED